MESLIVLGVFGLGALLFNKALSTSDGGYETAEENTEVQNPSGGFYINEGGDMPTYLSEDGLEILKKRESFSPRKYWDHKGFSIGYGHLIKPGETFSEPMSIEVGTDLLMRDVAWAEAAVYGNVKVPITQNQFDALVSFVYTIGEPAFRKSTILKKINAGDETAADEFERWNLASGTVNAGLVNRREQEREQFLG